MSTDTVLTDVKSPQGILLSIHHAMYHGNSDHDGTTITGALRKGIQAKVWTQAVVLIISAQTWSMDPACRDLKSLKDPFILDNRNPKQPAKHLKIFVLVP